MPEKFQNKYRITSARLQHWDYWWSAAYFVTICTLNREHFFGKIEDGKMNLSHQGILADVFWHEIKHHAKNVELGAFVVMPNHIHGILILNNTNVDDIDTVDNDNTVSATVETRHALSLQPQSPSQLPQSPNEIGNDGDNDKNADNGNNVDNAGNGSNVNNAENVENVDTVNNVNPVVPIDPVDPVETRHALSLQSQSQPPSESQLRSQSSSPPIQSTDPDQFNESDGTIKPIQSHQRNHPQPMEHDKTIGQQRFQNQGKNSLSSIIGSYKSAVTKHANRLELPFGWQTRFHEHIIRDDVEYQRIKNYIINNPTHWEEDKFYI